MENRLPSLDGLRALSIVMVIYWHLVGIPQFQTYDFHVSSFFISGDLGVHIFFVISGFLITTILLSEERKKAAVSLRKFYIRRTFRIFPAYYFYMAVVIVLDLFIVSDLDIRSIVEPLTYTTGLLNSPHITGWTVSHSWSLSVEEQYYLLYPLVFFVILKTTPWVRKWILLFFLVLVPLLRIVIYKFFAPDLMDSILYRGDCILWGCLLGMFSEETKSYFVKRQNILNASILVLFGVNILLKIFAHNFMLGFLTIPFTYTAQSVFAVALIIRFTLLGDPTSLFYAFLNNRVVRFVGVLSYSIYLWQEFVLQPQASPFVWKQFPWNIAVIFALAMASYFLIERPFLKLRMRLTTNA